MKYSLSTWLILNKPGQYRTESLTNLKGGKDNFAEGGTKVTTLVMSTKHFFKQRVNKKLVHVTDWFPTLLNMAGVPAKTHNDKFPLDGQDISSYLAPKNSTVEEQGL